MRTAIVGSGRLGSLFGGLLARAGENVTLLARGRNLEVLRERGLGRARGGVRGLLLGVIASNLGNLLRRLVLPLAIQSWSLTSLQQRLFKTGGRLIRHGRYFILQLAESYLTSTRFRQILGPIERLAWHPT